MTVPVSQRNAYNQVNYALDGHTPNDAIPALFDQVVEMAATDNNSIPNIMIGFLADSAYRLEDPDERAADLLQRLLEAMPERQTALAVVAAGELTARIYAINDATVSDAKKAHFLKKWIDFADMLKTTRTCLVLETNEDLADVIRAMPTDERHAALLCDKIVAEVADKPYLMMANVAEMLTRRMVQDIRTEEGADDVAREQYIALRSGNYSLPSPVLAASLLGRLIAACPPNDQETFAHIGFKELPSINMIGHDANAEAQRRFQAMLTAHCPAIESQHPFRPRTGGTSVGAPQPKPEGGRK